MKIKPILISAFLLAASSVYGQREISTDTILWSGTRRLSWSDFRAEPPSGTRLAGEAFCKISGYWDKPYSDASFKVFAVFDRSESWVNPAAKNDYVLLYFQVMFNLYEEYARKLRLELPSADSGNDIKSAFQAKYNAIMTSLSDEFTEFSNDTRMGQDKGAIIRWNKQVNEELKMMEKH